MHFKKPSNSGRFRHNLKTTFFMFYHIVVYSGGLVSIKTKVGPTEKCQEKSGSSLNFAAKNRHAIYEYQNTVVN